MEDIMALEKYTFSNALALSGKGKLLYKITFK